MWFKKKRERPLEYWEMSVYPEFRWFRVASGYDTDSGEYNYLTEPELQYKISRDQPWRQVTTQVDTLKPVVKTNA